MRIGRNIKEFLNPKMELVPNDIIVLIIEFINDIYDLWNFEQTCKTNKDYVDYYILYNKLIIPSLIKFCHSKYQTDSHKGICLIYYNTMFNH